MAIAEIIFWWYSKGWRVFIKKVGHTFSNVTDFFSMDSLIRTLFKPFRQISAGSAHEGASLELKFHMFIDRLISRVVGFFSRLTLLIAGTIIILFEGILSVIFILLWPIVPLIPIVGIVLTIMGVTL